MGRDAAESSGRGENCGSPVPAPPWSPGPPGPRCPVTSSLVLVPSPSPERHLCFAGSLVLVTGVWHREGSGFADGLVLPYVGHAVAAGRPWDVCGAPGHEGLRHKVPCVGLASWEKKQNGSERWEKGKCKGEKVVLDCAERCCAVLCHALVTLCRAGHCCIVLCSATLRCAVQCRAVQCCGTLRMPNHSKLSCAEPGCAMTCCVVKCRTVLCRVEPGCAILCLAALYHAVPCHAVPCHAIPCYTLLHALLWPRALTPPPVLALPGTPGAPAPWGRSSLSCHPPVAHPRLEPKDWELRQRPRWERHRLRTLACGSRSLFPAWGIGKARTSRSRL